MWLRREAVVVGFGVLLAGGCSLITSYDGFGSAGSPPTATCGPRIPVKPAAPDTADNGAVLRGALKSLRFGPLPNQGLGFDLDESCTKVACLPRGGRPADTRVKVGNEGVDNVVSAFIQQLISPSDAKFSDNEIQKGHIGLVVELTKWNRQENDPAVAVSLYNVVDVNPGDAMGARFEGADAFVVPQNELATGSVPDPAHTDLGGYVTRGTLVAHFPTFSLRLKAKSVVGVFGILELVFTEARLVGTVVAGPNGVQLTGAQLVGRFDQKDMLRGLARLGYCQGSGPDGGASLYPSDKGLLCGLLDLTDSRATDGKNQVCAAASVAFGMDFVANSVAPMGGAAPPVLNECPSDPDDTCAP